LWTPCLGDSPRTVCSRSEYIYHDVVDDDLEVDQQDIPILAGLEVQAAGQQPCKPHAKPIRGEMGRPEVACKFAA